MEAFLEEFQHLKIELEKIKSATNNFDETRVIGEGGFGKVYIGVLSHSKGENTVAFKRLNRNNGQGDPEFLKEITMLSRHTHENLISLVGFCDEDGEKIIVYEHASHGSLEDHLGSPTLTWTQRLKICQGVAMGLCYLHDPKETQQRVIHRDIKSSNILLDGNWNGKISDMGLSKIAPANQKDTFVVTNAVGTVWYIDPVYREKSILTKESDVYSFGVVLFEVLCGRLCFKSENGHFQSLVPTWKQSYEENQLEEIIFQDLKQHMDLGSMKTFSDIAYKCLQKSGEKPPEMSQVVEELEIALQIQENSDEVEQPINYEELSKNAVPPLVYESEEKLKMLLCEGIFVNGGKTWFWINKNGQHGEMISAAECLISLKPKIFGYPKLGKATSRFPIKYDDPLSSKFKTHVRAQFLSPHITYKINLVFEFLVSSKDNLGINYKLAGETKYSTLYYLDEREDGWLMAELYHFTSNSRNVDLEITFDCKESLAVEGIEFQPLEILEHQVLEDAEVDMQTISDSDTNWEQRLPSDYRDIIQLTRNFPDWTTKKELYSILRKGFPIKDNNEWFSLCKNGKRCHMLAAAVALVTDQWEWRFLHESRFGRGASDAPNRFEISCSSNILSHRTRYAAYLVFKLNEKHSGFQSRVLVGDYFYLHRYIYLLTPQIPVIRRNFNQNTHNPIDRPKQNCFPQQRNDGWMEVQLLEFQTGTTSTSIRLEIFPPGHGSFEGLIVEGIEFKPI